MEELIDVLDCYGEKTGIVKLKSEVKRDGDYHRAISVCIINDNNEILMQRRSINKVVYPGLWSIFVKGHVVSNESSIDACIREIFEELGIIIDSNELKYLYTIKDEKITNFNYIEKIFFDTYLLRKNININDVIIQKEELEEVEFRKVDDVLCDIFNSNVIVPNNLDYERIFNYLERGKQKIK